MYRPIYFLHHGSGRLCEEGWVVVGEVCYHPPKFNVFADVEVRINVCVWGGRCPFPLGDTLHLHADWLKGIHVTQLVPCSSIVY